MNDPQILTVVCDANTLRYMFQIGCHDVLPKLFPRVITSEQVLKEMRHPHTPESVRFWAENPSSWLKVEEPRQLLDLPAVGRKGVKGDGERAVISLALEGRAQVVLTDDDAARKQLKKLSEALPPEKRPQHQWMLQVLQAADERGLINSLPDRLEYLIYQTKYNVGEKALGIIRQMIRESLERTRARELSQHLGNALDLGKTHRRKP